MKILTAIAVSLAVTAGAAQAAPVDLSTWISEDGFGTQPPANWNLAGDNNSVTQTVNSDPGVFYDGNGSSQGKALSGTIRVNTASDDDFIGFVLGFDNGELNGTAASTDYWLVSWKQGNQNHLGEFAAAGLSLSHVTGTDPTGADLWGHVGVVNEVKRGTSLGNVGWSDLTEYTFDLIFTSTLIQVWVNGALEISHAGNFEDGGFGFFNYSQTNVTYAGIEEDVAPGIPLPAGLPLMLAGLGAFGLASRRRKG